MNKQQPVEEPTKRDFEMKTCIIHEEWYKAYKNMPPKQFKELMSAIIEYGCYGIDNEKNLSQNVKPIFFIVKSCIDRDVKKYMEQSRKGQMHTGNQHTRKKQKIENVILEQTGTKLEQTGTVVGQFETELEQTGTYYINTNTNANKNFNSSNISEKAKILNEVTFYFFNSGCKRPYDEAVKAYEYNEGKKWASLKSKSSDSTTDKIEFLKGWLKNRQETPHNTLVKRDCMAYLMAIKALPDMLKDDDLMQLINGFSGLDNVGESTIKIKCSKNDAIKSLESLLRFSESNKAKFIEGIQSAGGQYKLCEDVEFKIQEYDI